MTKKKNLIINESVFIVTMQSIKEKMAKTKTK